MCKVKFAATPCFTAAIWDSIPHKTADKRHIFVDIGIALRFYRGINWFTLMSNHSVSSSKRRALEESGTFNPRAAEVRHPLFGESDFFDPCDLVQLKYEALRALEKEGYSVAGAARAHGLSRPSVYQARSDFLQRGMEGLLPGKRGPKAAHKLTEKVREELWELCTRQPDLKAEELARRLGKRHGIAVHPRTIEKALKSDRAKRGRRRRRGRRR